MNLGKYSADGIADMKKAMDLAKAKTGKLNLLPL